jgi:hypothetical protein
MKIAYLATWTFQDRVTRARFFYSRPEVDEFVFGFGGEFERSFKDDLGHVSIYNANYGPYYGIIHIRTVMEVQ